MAQTKTIKGTHNSHTKPIPKLTCTYFIYLYSKTSRIAHRIFTSRSEDPVDKFVYGKKSLVARVMNKLHNLLHILKEGASKKNPSKLYYLTRDL